MSEVSYDAVLRAVPEHPPMLVARVEHLRLQAEMLLRSADVAVRELRPGEAFDLEVEALQRAQWAGDIEEEMRR